MKKAVLLAMAAVLALSFTACAQTGKTDSKTPASAKADSGGSQETTAEATTEEVIDAHFQIVVRAFDGQGNPHGEETGTIDGNKMTIKFTEDETDYTIVRQYNPNGFDYLPENPVYTGKQLERGDLEGVVQKCFGHVLSKQYTKPDGTVGEWTYTFDGNTMKETVSENDKIEYSTDYEFEQHGIAIQSVWHDADSEPAEPSIYKCEYDDAGNPVKVLYLNENNEYVVKQAFEYDASNRVVKRTDYAGSDKIDGYDVFEYDKNGNLTKIFMYLKDGKCWDYFELEYDEGGDLLKYTEYDDDKKQTVGRVYTYEYIR